VVARDKNAEVKRRAGTLFAELVRGLRETESAWANHRTHGRRYLSLRKPAWRSSADL